MKIQEIMTKTVDWVSADTALQEAARKMKEDDVGFLPIGENDRLIGMLTDRDIVLNCVAEGKDPSTQTARDAMHEGVRYLFEDQDIEEAADNMAKNKVRRMPVVNKDKRLVGILSLGDIAAHGQQDCAGRALEEIAKAA
ncbi:CBS domain protein [Tepidicaulis marinus]|jgi:CBS domain-containing protein|uniref:CBS domain protein n=1 Tax=Tepidicaulis marinus TaxID=1333998 RepID=A0A081BFC1_9HYPH|nr:CBS domain-containing protein [Tepidicaulis marinus]GAK46739.1 CBS domain protein [Tepidicaulis marinus]